jgi:monovalent cation:proton antiporter-2 (CPA2) family protein
VLEILVVLLAAAVLFVSFSRRLGFGSVLGYLVAGAVIGPFGLRLVNDYDQIAEVSELGVVMLLFLIGIELRPQRLWVMRRAVFGLGAGQVAATGLVLAALAYWAGLGWRGATVLGVGLALSSTAIVLPMLGERDMLSTRAGRDTFAVLLFQDLAFIPLVALVPLLSGGKVTGQVPWLDVLEAAAAVAAILLGGRFLVPPVFRLIGGARTPEVFTATALLLVVGTAFLANAVGLSMSLGAFLAGVLLSSSEYRHELQADIEPFEGLLLGFFFMSVGMSAQLGLAVAEPALILLGVLVLLAGKIAVAFGLARLAGQDARNALRFALALPQGSEFSFVLFAAAVAAGALARAEADRATLIIALSMAATPILFAAAERFVIPHLVTAKAPVEYDVIDDATASVIICGFGRMGQIIGRILRMQGIAFTALEQDATQIEVVRRFGNKVYYGNPERPELLRAAGAETALLLVIALDDMEETLRVAEIARRTFPKLKILARARNRRHAHLLMDRGIPDPVRETFYSSLRLTEMVLDAIGLPAEEAHRAVELFREYDERWLRDSHAFYEDERQLIQSGQQAADELAGLFESDKPVPKRVLGTSRS